MAEIVLKMVALIFQRIERLIFDAPASSCPLHDAIHRALVDTQSGDPTKMLDFALSRGLPALDEIEPKFRIGGIERHVTDETKPMVHLAFVVFTLIIGHVRGWTDLHATGSLGLSDLLEQKRVVALFDPQDVTHVVLLQGLNMRGIRTQAVFGDNHLEMGVVLTKLA